MKPILAAFLICLLPGCLRAQNPQSSNYPVTLDTDANLFVASNRPAVQRTLSGAINSSQTSFILSSGAGLIAPVILSIDSEVIDCQLISVNTVSGCVRGSEGTTAASHSNGANVYQYLTAAYTNTMTAALKAVELANANRTLGLPLSGGTANAQTITLAPAPASWNPGMYFCWLPSIANTSGTPTINPNGLGAKTITKNNGALSANDLTSTSVACVIYDGVVAELQNPQTSSGGGGGGSFVAPFVTTSTTTTLTITVTPPANYSINNVPFTVSAGVVTVTRAAGTASELLLVGIGLDQHIKLISPTNTYNCTPGPFSGCDTITGSSAPYGVMLISSDSMGAGGGSWTFSTTPNDLRSVLNVTSLTAASGIVVTPSGATLLLGIDPAIVAQKFFGAGAPGLLSGSTRGDLYYDTTTIPWNGYVCASTQCATGSPTWYALGGGGATVWIPLSVHLTSSQIQNMFTTPVTLVNAPGSNLYVQVASIDILYKFATTAYTGGGHIFVGYGSGASLLGGFGSYWDTPTFTAAASQVSWQGATTLTTDTVANIVNQPVTMFNITSAFTLGDGDAYAHVLYRLVSTIN